jgi:Serine dehydrogenase proteinase
VPRYHELIVNAGGGPERFEKRQELLKQIEARTGRPIVVYAANINAPNVPNSLDHSDLTPFSDLTRTVSGSSIDVLLHSPGGLAEAAERIVHLLRARFDSVRFVIPHTAFSAATMLAASADELVLDDTSALGPIDPQIIIRDPQTGQSTTVPTQAVLDGFNNAREDVRADPDILGVYLPLLSKLDLPIFEICKNAEKLSKSLVKSWLMAYLLKDEIDREKHAEEITHYLSSHKDRLSHGRPVTLTTITEELKIKRVLDLKTDPALRALISELWGEIEWFVDQTGTAKFFENAYGVAFRRTFQIQQQPQFVLPPMPRPQSPRPPSPGSAPPGPPQPTPPIPSTPTPPTPPASAS